MRPVLTSVQSCSTLTAIGLAMVLGCAPRDVSKPATPEDVAASEARVRASIDALARRVDALEQREASVSASPAAPPAGWSCMAKCGQRDTQTTEFRVVYRRVTGHGESAATAYQALLDACDGTLYQRIENDAFVGGELRDVCLRDAASE